MSKDAISMDPKDGVSWCEWLFKHRTFDPSQNILADIMGNALMGMFFGKSDSRGDDGGLQFLEQSLRAYRQAVRKSP